MSTTTLKAQISKLLTSVEDERFLHSITAMLQTYVADQPALTPEEDAIKEGWQDMKAGRLLSQQQIKENSQVRYPTLKP